MAKAPTKTKGKTPVKVLKKASGKKQEISPAKVEGKLPVKDQEKAPAKKQAKSPAKIQEKVPVGIQEKTPVKVQEKVPVKIQTTTPAKVQEKPVIKDQKKNDKPVDITPRLKTFYKTQIISNLMKKLNYKNEMEVPRILKICLNQGVRDAVTDKRFMEGAAAEMTLITGQKPLVTKAKKDISNFKLRKGLAIAVKTTLRGSKMYEFLDRLIAVSLPRIRDFKGVNPKSFDGRGNYTLGITEQIIFPEIDLDKVSKINGMDITFVTNAQTDNEARALLEEFGMPFRAN